MNGDKTGNVIFFSLWICQYYGKNVTKQKTEKTNWKVLCFPSKHKIGPMLDIPAQNDTLQFVKYINCKIWIIPRLFITVILKCIFQIYGYMF